MPALQAIEHLVGLQSQAPNPPYLGLWARLRNFRPEDLAQLVRARTVVRLALMRSTIHLVSARDALVLRPVIASVIERAHVGGWGRILAGVDLREVARAGRALVEERPRTFEEVGKLLQARWPAYPAMALAYTVRAMVPLVQVPPRGLWGERGAALHTTAEKWLGQPVDAHASLEAVLLRYLRAFGPASVADMQKWSGLTRLKEVVDAMRNRLAIFRDERGRELFDLPGTRLPDEDTDAPVRLLPEWDNILLSHDDRSRICRALHHRRIMSPNGMVPGTVLIDGFVGGTWKVQRSKSGAALVVEFFEATSRTYRGALMDEAARLLQLTDPQAASHDLIIRNHHTSSAVKS